MFRGSNTEDAIVDVEGDGIDSLAAFATLREED
jgi:hypothetical protein